MLRDGILILVGACGLVGCSGAPEVREGSAVSDAGELYRRGTELLETDPAAAIDLLTKSLAINPDAPPAIYNRAVAYAPVGRDTEAVADIDRLERVAPAIGRKLRAEMELSAEPYVDIAKSECQAGKYQAALKKCDSALAYCPNYGDAWVVKGIVLQKMGQSEKALECYTKATQLEPANYWAFLNRAEFYHAHKRLREGLADYAKSIELRPRDPDPYSGRSAVYSDLGMPQEAAADAARAAELKAKQTAK
jgi:tetratricopeptide (TPR) repeat protein